MYEFAYGMNPDGTPNLVPGQSNVIDVLPGQSGYSDLWQINLVTVPQGYQADTIRSAMDITASALPVTPTNTLVNRPVVAAGSTVSGGRSLTQAWYQGQPVQYVDFGPNQDTTSTVYVLITGLDAQGNPLAVPGQSNIFTTVPGQLDYSAFCIVNLVTVPAGYVPDT